MRHLSIEWPVPSKTFTRGPEHTKKNFVNSQVLQRYMFHQERKLTEILIVMGEGGMKGSNSSTDKSQLRFCMKA